MENIEVVVADDLLTTDLTVNAYKMQMGSGICIFYPPLSSPGSQRPISRTPSPTPDRFNGRSKSRPLIEGIGSRPLDPWP